MLHLLFRHMEWADSRVWQAVLANPRSTSDSVVRDRLFHIHLTQRAFLHLWQQRPLDFPEQSSFPDLEAIASWGQRGHGHVAAWIRTVEDTALEREVQIPWADHVAARFGRPAAPVTLADTMVQVVSHTTHHRGQVSARLRELGGEPPLTDFIAWVWLGKPHAHWPVLDGDSRPAGV